MGKVRVYNSVTLVLDINITLQGRDDIWSLTAADYGRLLVMNDGSRITSHTGPGVVFSRVKSDTRSCAESLKSGQCRGLAEPLLCVTGR